MFRIIILLFGVLFTFCSPKLQSHSRSITGDIQTGAEQTHLYLDLLKGKRVGVLANQTSIIGKSHLVDSLQNLGINIVKVFYFLHKLPLTEPMH